MLDPLHMMQAWSLAIKINNPYTPFVTAAAVADGDVAGVVAAAERLALFRESKREDWTAFVEVVVYRPDEVADSGRAGRVAAQGGFAAHAFVAEGRRFGS
jgi:hypothetical protein